MACYCLSHILANRKDEFLQLARSSAQVGVVMAVHAGLALLLAVTPHRDGTLGKTRLSAIQQALQKPAAA